MASRGSEATDRSNDVDRSSSASADESSARRRSVAATPTTILLSRDGEDWRATQRGVDVAGSGDTAPRAIAAYCGLIEARADRTEGASADASAAAVRETASEETHGVDGA